MARAWPLSQGRRRRRADQPARAAGTPRTALWSAARSAHSPGELINPHAQPAPHAQRFGQRRGLPTALTRAGCVAMLDVAGLAEDPVVDAAVGDAPLTAPQARLGPADGGAVQADGLVGLCPVARPLPAAIDARRERKPIAPDPDLRRAVGRSARDPRHPSAHAARTKSAQRARHAHGPISVGVIARPVLAALGNTWRRAAGSSSARPRSA